MNGSSAVLARLVDVHDAVTTIPTRRAWGRCVLIYLAFVACALPLGVASGLLHVTVAPLTPLASAIVIAAVLVHPALTEEIVFRALLLPRRPATMARARLAIAVGVALFLYVAAHPLNAWLFRPADLGVFANPWYLAMATLLGVACTAAYLVSGSIWPPVVMHWATVVVWLLTLGGQGLLSAAR